MLLSHTVFDWNNKQYIVANNNIHIATNTQQQHLNIKKSIDLKIQINLLNKIKEYKILQHEILMERSS